MKIDGEISSNFIQKKTVFSLLINLFTPVILITLFFGLRPKEYDFRNNAAWLEDGFGIAFRKYGIAYTEPFLRLATREPLTIEIGFAPQPSAEDGFSHLLTIYGGSDETQLVVGQWRDGIVVMSGDDYDNRRRTPKLVFAADAFGGNGRLLTLICDERQTRAFVDGKAAGRKEGIGLKGFGGKGSARIILGNSVYGKHPWTGMVDRLALYYGTEDGSVKSKALAVYRFDEKSGDRVLEHSGNGADLKIPGRVKALKLQFLEARFDTAAFDRKQATDFGVNFFGFIPFGLVMAARLKRGGAGRWRIVLWTLVAGFALSLFIESVQVWLPSRSSDLFDLVLNTAGAGAGCLLATRSWEVGRMRR